MEWWHVYLFTRLDGINTLFGITGIIGTAVFLIAAFSDFMFRAEAAKEGYDLKKLRNSIGYVAVPALIALLALPTQKEAAAIYLLPKLAHSDFAKEAQQIPTDAAKLMRLKLEAWIADMEPPKGEKK